MRKIVIILFLGPLLGGCSVIRTRTSNTFENSNMIFSGNILESVKNQNITENNFFIRKAEIELLTQNGKEKFITNIKFEKPDKYLISLRSRSGIEGARIYINKDSIVVNDRINKKMYLCSSLYVKRKYGLTQSFLPLIFGDVVLEKNFIPGNEKCNEGKLIFVSVVRGVKFNYDIDCKKRKAVLANEINNFVQNGVRITYERFFRTGNIVIPGNIEFIDSKYNINLKIRILKIESPWIGSIKFVPGKGYELIELV